MTEQELMLTSILECERVDLYVDHPVLSPSQKQRLQEMRISRQRGEPLQYILGSSEFMGLKLKVDQRVLIPRPETELLVEAVIEKIKLFFQRKSLQILDLGTGSGNVAISLAKFVEHCQVTAIDISQEAIDVASQNAKAQQVDQKIHFVCADMADYLREPCTTQSTFDIIISNPPYIPTDQLAYLPRDVQREPHRALDGGSEGMDFYRLILAQSKYFLNHSGFLFFEVGDGQRAKLEKLCSSYVPFAKIEFHKDYAQTERIMILINFSDTKG